MLQPFETLICFAVREEAQPTVGALGSNDARVLLTGIGPRNAEQAITKALAAQKPKLVLSCGFAGGLRPDLRTGAVLFAAEEGTSVAAALLAAGARPARFHTADKVASTVAQKSALWETTGADAVEMESGRITAVCREQGVPCAIVRVVLDTANEDLPLDFNEFLTADQRMSYLRLAAAVLRAPGTVAALVRLQRRSNRAAKDLAKVLLASGLLGEI